MLKNYIELLMVYKIESFNLFKNTKEDRKLIHEYEWDNIDINNSILFEVELFSMDIYGYASSLTEDNFSRVEETINSLEKKSIYKNKIFLLWLSSENIVKYSDYFMYILFLENFRIAVIETCHEYRKIDQINKEAKSIGSIEA